MFFKNKKQNKTKTNFVALDFNIAFQEGSVTLYCDTDYQLHKTFKGILPDVT